MSIAFCSLGHCPVDYGLYCTLIGFAYCIVVTYQPPPRRISVVLPFQEMFPIEEDRRYLPDHVPVSVCIVQPGILEHLPVQGRGRTVSESPIAVTDVAGG